MKRWYVALIFLSGMGMSTAFDIILFKLPTPFPTWVHMIVASICLGAAIVTFVLAPMQKLDT